MLTEINTAADFQKLPSYLRTAILTPPVRGLRHHNHMERALRKTAIQRAVVRAVQEGYISRELAVQCLVVNKAYGKAGKAAIAGI